MKIFLVRHGETKENLAGIFQGHSHGNLSDKGIEQAQKLSHRLAKENFDIIFSSDLNRALNTAKIILKQQPKATLKTSQLLRETDLGDWTGTKISEANFNNTPTNMETPSNCQKRFLNFLAHIYQNFSEKKILIVAHKGFIIHGLRHFLHIQDYQDAEKKIPQNNTALNIFKIKKNLSGEIEMLNNTDHLL